MHNEFDIIVVGLGPSGATLANLLGQAGVKTLVLEREKSAYHLPRAVQFDDEVMRVFQNIGLAADIEKTTRYNPGMRFVNAEGDLLLDWPRPPGLTRNGWLSSYRFHQPDLEDILRQGLQRFANVETREQSRLDSVHKHHDHLEVTYTDLTTGNNESVRCKYLVGCDGANSTVRTLMQTSMFDYGFKERWLVVDVVLQRPMPKLGDYTIQYCVPERPATYVRGPGDRRRWEITIPESDSSDDVSQPEKVWEYLKPWLQPQDATIERAAVYTFQSSTAKKWRNGSMLIAGDAAHLMPPFMGQGMCTGIRDVANLAWKLIRCCQISKLANDPDGREENALLDSYQQERLPHADEYIQTAIKLGGLINASGTTEALNSVFLNKDGSNRMKMLAPRLGNPLTAGDPTHSGTIFAQASLDAEQMLDDVAPYQSILICEDSFWQDPIGNDQGPAGFEQTANTTLITTEKHPALQETLHSIGCRAALLRPDRYILGTANQPAELLALCNHLAHYSH